MGVGGRGGCNSLEASGQILSAVTKMLTIAAPSTAAVSSKGKPVYLRLHRLHMFREGMPGRRGRKGGGGGLHRKTA